MEPDPSVDPTPPHVVPAAAALLPIPRRVVFKSANLRIGRELSVRWVGERTDRLERAVVRLRTGLQAVVAEEETGGGPLRLEISCRQVGARYPQLGDAEDYRLEVNQDRVYLSGACEWGVLCGLSTLTQLGTGQGELRCCEIDDEPRFSWRGLLLDVARHFIGVDALKRTLDGMALCKLNVLHLHLTDDQGFRFPSARFPRLASEQHFTRDELTALVDYAADRGIRVVPEIDMPGHTNSWLVAYPEWGTQRTRPTRRFGVHESCLDPSNEAVYAALSGLLEEVASVFPDHYLHVGGDEVSPRWWTVSADVQQFMADRDIADIGGLQAHFNARLVDVAEDLGKGVVAWDEALHESLPAKVVVQAWRGATARGRALASGHDCVVSSSYYLDLFFPAEVYYRFDPEADETVLTDLEDQLLDDPRFAHVAQGMRWTQHWRKSVANSGGGSGRVLGAEACLWGELVSEPLLDGRLWSRLPALAERFWSPATVTDPHDLYVRLPLIFQRLAAVAGVDILMSTRKLMADAGVSEDWWPLIEQLEPVKWYGRLLGEQALAARLAGTEMPQARPYHVDTPMNRVVDALLPESFAARAVAGLCRRQQAGDRESATELRRLAGRWQALGEGAGCVEELVPAALRLAELGGMVLGILDGRIDAESARPILDVAGAPQGEYMIAVVPVLRSWIEGVAG